LNPTTRYPQNPHNNINTTAWAQGCGTGSGGIAIGTDRQVVDGGSSRNTQPLKYIMTDTTIDIPEVCIAFVV
jgi:hypothetical protein